jgi:hypothetical protein
MTILDMSREVLATGLFTSSTAILIFDGPLVRNVAGLAV